MADVSEINEKATYIENALKDMVYDFHQKYPGILLSISANTETIELSGYDESFRSWQTKFDRTLIILP